MITKPFRPLVVLSIFVLIVALACGGPGNVVQPTATQAAVQVEVPTKESVVEQPTATTQPVQAEANLVATLQDVKKATIQIESQGSFIDPEFGFVYNSAGRGSGFIIDPSGIAVTNNHVVTGAALLKVWVGGDTGKTYNAKVLGVSECSDLAVIDIEGDGFPYMNWYTGSVGVGLEIYAAGFPLGDPEFTLTKGIVSKEKADGETGWASVDSVIEHDATINPGNSGGPLVTKDGEIVGVNYAGASQTNQYFAIGEDVALPMVNELRAGKDIDSIGVNGQAVMSDDGSLTGIWVSSVQSGSPADKTGIKGGDIITLMEGLVLGVDSSMSQYCDILRTHSPGDTLSVEVLRWLTGEYLTGQLNGRALEVASTFSDELSGDVSDSDPTTYEEYTLYTDNSEQIQIEIPNEWVEVDGTPWIADWETSSGTISFEAPAITAAASIDNFNATYDESGVFFAASKRMGEIGGYLQLLDGVRGWNESDCDLNGTYDYGSGDYEDPLYEGKFDLWENCGENNTNVLVLAARPKADPTAYLLLLQIVITKDADLDALDHILASFQANF